MISNIQVLRALAALAVVLYHTQYLLHGVHTEFEGVAVFFVISGFIMTMVTRENADGFLAKRLIRIVPVYWIFTVLSLLPRWLAHTFLHMQVHNSAGSGDTLASLVKSLLFIPYHSYADGQGNDMFPIIGVGWTLNEEMFFYLLFAAALRISRRRAPALVALALLAVKGLAWALPSPPDLLAFYARPCTSFFILGILTWYVWKGTSAAFAGRHATAYARCAVVLAAAFLAWNLTPETAAVRQGFCGAVVDALLPMLAVFAALLLHDAGIRCRWRPALLMGDASYALYLTHSFAIVFLQKLGVRWAALDPASSLPAVALILVFTSFAAIGIYAYIERPAIRTLRRMADGMERRATAP